MMRGQSSLFLAVLGLCAAMACGSGNDFDFNDGVRPQGSAGSDIAGSGGSLTGGTDATGGASAGAPTTKGGSSSAGTGGGGMTTGGSAGNTAGTSGSGGSSGGSAGSSAGT